jgi:hypothetical protein
VSALLTIPDIGHQAKKNSTLQPVMQHHVRQLKKGNRSPQDAGAPPNMPIVSR